MRLFFLIFFFGLTACFAQKEAKPKTDSLDVKIISQREFLQYLERINAVVMDQFKLSEADKHQVVLNELRAILAEVDRKRKAQK